MSDQPRPWHTWLDEHGKIQAGPIEGGPLTDDEQAMLAVLAGQTIEETP